MRIDRNSLSGNRLRRTVQRLAVGTATSSTEVNATGGIINTATGIALGPPAPYLPLSAGSTYPLSGDLYLGGNVLYFDSLSDVFADGSGDVEIDLTTLLIGNQIPVSTVTTNSYQFATLGPAWYFNTNAATCDLFINAATSGGSPTGLQLSMAGGQNLVGPSASPWYIQRTGEFTGTGFLAATGKNYLTLHAAQGSTTVGGVVSLSSTFQSTATYSIGAYCTVNSTSTDTVKLSLAYFDENSTHQFIDLIPMNNNGAATIVSTGAYLYPQVEIRTYPSSKIILYTSLPTSTGSISYDVGGTISRIF